MSDNKSPVSILEEDFCWEILAKLEVGRLGTAVDGKPEIFPINYVVDGPSIVFQSAQGSKLDELAVNNQVVFEVDTWDFKGGKSIIIHGEAKIITSPEELRRAEHLGLLPWVKTVKTNYVRIIPDNVSGRDFRFG